MKKLFYLYLSTFVAQAQIALYGDAYLPAQAAIALHAPEVHFLNGIVHTQDNDPGYLAFGHIAHALQPSHSAYSQAPVYSLGHPAFVFPVGDNGLYQPLAVSDADNTPRGVQFKRETHASSERQSTIEHLADFYWAIDGQNNARVRLSWNSFSGIDQIADETAALRIAGFNGTQWEMIPAQVDPYTLDGLTPTALEEGTISTLAPVDWSAFSAFTIAAVELDTDLRVAEGITPNNDGLNDRWVIHNIDRYPNAVIRVFNRWGAQVFQADGNYQNDWDATYNNNTKILPEGPYYYRIDSDGDGIIDRDGWIYINH